MNRTSSLRMLAWGTATALIAFWFEAIRASYISGRYPVDFGVYLEAARAVRDHAPLYGVSYDVDVGEGTKVDLPYLYPPLLALSVTPLLHLPPLNAAFVWLMINFACLVAASSMITAGSGRAPFLTPLLIVGALCFRPTIDVLSYGQVGLILLLLLAAASSSRVSGIVGALVAFAAWLKMTPALYIIAELKRRDLEAIIGFLVAALALGGLQVLLGADMSAFFTFLSGTGNGWNTLDASEMTTGNIAPLLQFRELFGHARSSVAEVVLQFVIVIGIFISAIVVCRDRRILFAALTPPILLASPVLWHHHLVLLVLPVGYLLAFATRPPLVLSISAVALMALSESVLHLSPKPGAELIWYGCVKGIPILVTLAIWYTVLRHAQAIKNRTCPIASNSDDNKVKEISAP